MGDKVRFQLSDVFLPNPDEVMVPPPLTAEMEGTVIGFSDSGEKRRAFAVVEVVRTQTVVVPVDRLGPAAQASQPVAD